MVKFAKLEVDLPDTNIAVDHHAMSYPISVDGHDPLRAEPSASDPKPQANSQVIKHLFSMQSPGLFVKIYIVIHSPENFGVNSQFNHPLAPQNLPLHINIFLNGQILSYFKVFPSLIVVFRELP